MSRPLAVALAAAGAAEAPARSLESADSIEAAHANGDDDTDPSLIAKGTEIAVADVEEMKLEPGPRSIAAVPPREGAARGLR